MALAGNGGVLVPAPRCEGWPGGLLSAAELDERTDNAWLRGLEFEQELCVSGAPAVVSMQCPPPVEQLKLTNRGYDVDYVDPFVIYAGWECSTMGEADRAWDHADAIFDAGWKRALERAFWTGVDQDGNTFRGSLAGGDAVDLTPGGGAVDVVTGISLLEGFMSTNFPCLPTFHASVMLSAYMAEKAQVRRESDGSLHTPAGSRVALGGGYPLTGPSGSAPGANEGWIFASGPVRVTTGPKFYAPDRGDLGGAVDRLVNDVAVFVEKGFAVQVACGLAAVRVKLAGLE